MDKETSHLSAAYQRLASEVRTHSLRVKGWKRYSVLMEIKRAGIVILNKMDFKTNIIIKDRGHYIILKGQCSKKI